MCKQAKNIQLTYNSYVLSIQLRFNWHTINIQLRCTKHTIHMYKNRENMYSICANWIKTYNWHTIHMYKNRENMYFQKFHQKINEKFSFFLFFWFFFSSLPSVFEVISTYPIKMETFVIGAFSLDNQQLI